MPKANNAVVRHVAPMTHAHPQSEQPDLIQLHAQACNGLHAALHHLTTPSTEPDAVTLARALSRVIRASTALKQACAVAKEEVTA
ncbi:MAG: hypothetical protein RLZZ612_649 [Pseudomonadota bacterium]|jgi:hypothetical protein